jgi:prolyl-tRNA synthetase
LALGSRDIENGTIEIARRDTLEKETYQITDIEIKVKNLLEKIQDNLYKKALTFREEKTFKADSKQDFVHLIQKGGFIYAHWDGTSETEELIKQETKATIRCIPLKDKKEVGICLFSGKQSDQRVLFAKAY